MKTLGYGLKQGFKNIIQNKIFSLVAIGTIAICLFLLGLFYVLLSNFQHMMYNVESSVGLTVFFDEGTTPEEIDALGEKIRAYDGVEEVVYISPAEAWDKFQKEMYQGDKDLQDTFGDENPLQNSASFEVSLTNVSKQAAVTKYIKSLDGIRKVNGSGSVAKSLNSANMLVAYVSGTIIVLLLLVSVFLISNAVATGIRVRKDEISIIKMIGATDGFIRAPFLVEGLVIGLLGAIVPLTVLWFLYERVIRFVVHHFSALSQWLAFVEPSKEFMTLVPMSLLVGVGIGFVGSAVSVHKHLRD
ncbi:MAG: permease-like cell division protein FtsX [Lachnospiraceae bacterium]|nr:permease-like cell division protein FtsX [Lachnospiraceae bacterium]